MKVKCKKIWGVAYNLVLLLVIHIYLKREKINAPADPLKKYHFDKLGGFLWN